MTFYYVCADCHLIGSYEDIQGKGYDLPENIIHHPHPMVFSIWSYKETEHYLNSCINNKPKRKEQNAKS